MIRLVVIGYTYVPNNIENNIWLISYVTEE